MERRTKQKIALQFISLQLDRSLDLWPPLSEVYDNLKAGLYGNVSCLTDRTRVSFDAVSTIVSNSINVFEVNIPCHKSFNKDSIIFSWEA